jgi:predicted double-glycine peptidase
LTKGNNLQNPAQNTDLDNPSIVSTLVNSSIAVNSSSTLSTPLIKILEYAKEKDCFITASQVKSGIRLFRDSPVGEIRSYFQWLADHQHGIVRGEADTLEFSAQ